MAFQGKKPRVPKMRAWLSADPIYRRAVGMPNWKNALDVGKGGIVKGSGDIPTAYQSYRESAQRALGRTKSDYQEGMEQMREQKGMDIRDQQADFASRGLGFSGLRTQAQANYLNSFQEQAAAAARAKRRGITDIKAERTSQRNLAEQQIWNAYNEAVLRRIQKYGLRGQGA